MGDVACNDFPLLQMNLLEFVDLVDGCGEERLLHQEQMVIRFNPHDRIDDIFQPRRLRWG